MLYRTDTHWRQEDLFPVAATLAAALDSPLPTDFRDSFGYEHFDSFYGVYYGQSALNIPPDGLTWLVSEVTEKALVSSIEKPGQRLTVYDLEQLESPDPYNTFMCGSSAIVTARNMLNRSGRNLIIFRDSFAAPLAPLLLHSYGSVTLIDLRYVSPDLLENYVDFKDADVLFLYSAGLFQNCDSVRGTANSE
ncbi:MAG: DHHW family protein [Oscillospiraceae bacterium]|nr:DHHW family protein [Oscillospiraceae bacterium]